MQADHSRRELFDKWAASYDAVSSVAEGSFPFAGYDEALDRLAEHAQRLIASASQPRLLDLGVGTGNVLKRLEGVEAVGLDFSTAMLTEATARFPDLTPVQADLSTGQLPDGLGIFTLCTAGYVLHEFPDDLKVSLISDTFAHLTADGRVLVADITFPSADARAQAQQQFSDSWDPDESYLAAEEFDRLLGAVGVAVIGYEQISACTAVLTLAREQHVPGH